MPFSIPVPSWGTGRLPLAIILGTYCVIATSYSLITPLWEAPDEPSHYRYAQYLADNHVLPPPQPPQKGHFYENNFVTSLYEWYQPPLYYILIASLLTQFHVEHPQSSDGMFPPINPQFPSSAIRLFLPTDSVPLEFTLTSGPRLARSFSILLGLFTLVIIYHSVRFISPNDSILALTATGFTAFIPQFTFLTSYITNDNLADILSAAYLFTLINLIKAPENRLRASIVILALVASLGLIAKLSLLYALPLGIAAIVLRQNGEFPNRVWNAARGCLLFVGVYSAVALLCAMFIPGAIARLQWAQTTLPPKSIFMSVDYVMGLWPTTIESFWGRFGWVNVKTASWIAPLLSALSIVGLSSSCYAMLRSRIVGLTDRNILRLSFGNCLLVLVAFVFYNFADTQPQGRYLYPGIAAFSLLVCYGILRLNKKHRAITGLSLVVLLLCVNLISLFGYLIPAYHQNLPPAP